MWSHCQGLRFICFFFIFDCMLLGVAVADTEFVHLQGLKYC